MGKLSKRLVALVSTIAVTTGLVFTSLPSTAASAAVSVNNSSSSTNELKTSLQADSVEDGVILHAWMWSFNAIKEHLQEIADAGYTTIQTSPAQACRLRKSWNDTSLNNTNSNPTWYYGYQPTYYTLGNYQLGTAAEFKEMTTAAHKQGLKVIVDVVANHLADTRDSQYVDGELLSHCHNAGSITNWKDRNQVTQGAVIGMPDLDTSSSVVQNKLKNYLDILSDSGADGFRFDAAKSIELPSQYEQSGNKSSDFWTNIINEIKSKNPKSFVYGEVLQGDEPGTNFPGYAKIMNVTASTYGWFARSAVGYEVWEDGSGNLGGNGSNGRVTPTINSGLTSKYMDGQVSDGSIPNSKLVAFVETHDLYANSGASRCMSQNQIQLAWAIVAAREGAVPLFFNRPKSQSFGSNYLSPQGEAFNKVGEAGSDDYKQQNVVAMNKFHTVMEENNVGEKVDALNNNNVYRVQRGNKGLVLVNVSSNNQSINISNCNLENGTYNNGSTFGEKKYTVSNGNLSVNLPANSFVVLSKENTDIPSEPTATVSPEGGDFYGNSVSVKLGLSNATSGTYQVGNDSAVKFTSAKTISVGSELKVGESVTVKVNATDGKTTSQTKSYTFTKRETPVSTDDVYCEKPSGWGDTLYCYAYSDGTNNLGKWPGNKMNKNADGTYSYDLPDGWSGYVIFNDGGSNQYPGSGQQGLAYTAGTKMIYKDGKWTEFDSKLKLNSLTASKEIVDLGNEVIITPSVNGGKAPYTYTYTVNGEEKEANTDGTLTLEPNEEGNYVVNLSVKDSDGTEVTGTVTVKATFNKENPYIKSITGVKSGDNITYTVNAIGGEIGTNLLFYKFYIVDESGNKTIGQNYSLDNTFTTSASNKKIYVEVQNSYNTTVHKYYTYEKTEEGPSITSYETSLESPQVVGTSIKLTQAAEGGKGTLKYAFSVKKDGVETYSKAFATTKNAIWTPTDSGTYKITFTVRDGNGNTDSKTLSYVIKPHESDLAVQVKSPTANAVYTLGDTVNLSAVATGVQGTAKYRFAVYKNSTSVYSRSFKELDNASWKPTKVGKYMIMVKATDDSGKIVTSNKVYITVKAKSEFKFTKFKANLASPQEVNTLLILKTGFTGAKGDVQCKFSVIKDGKETIIQKYSTKGFAVWKPTEAGTYTLKAYANDGTKTITAKKTYVITEAKFKELSIENITTNLSSPQKKGTNINIVTDAVNGQGTLNYRYVVLKNGVNVYTRGYNSRNNAVWIPSEAGNYTIVAKVKDSTGKEVEKSITYTIK